MRRREWGTGGREVTYVGVPSEVDIPLRIALWMGIVGDVLILAGTLVVWLVSMWMWLHGSRQLRYWFVRWWARLEVNWPVIPILLLSWWAVPGALLLLKFALEQWQKNWPPPFAALEPTEVGMAGPIWGFVRSFKAIGDILKSKQQFSGYQKHFGKVEIADSLGSADAHSDSIPMEVPAKYVGRHISEGDDPQSRPRTT